MSNFWTKRAGREDRGADKVRDIEDAPLLEAAKDRILHVMVQKWREVLEEDSRDSIPTIGHTLGIGQARNRWAFNGCKDVLLTLTDFKGGSIGFAVSLDPGAPADKIDYDAWKHVFAKLGFEFLPPPYDGDYTNHVPAGKYVVDSAVANVDPTHQLQEAGSITMRVDAKALLKALEITDLDIELLKQQTRTDKSGQSVRT